MAARIELLSCNILEKDTNNDILCTWTFPSITEDQRRLIIRKCGLEDDSSQIRPFLFGRFRKSFYYIQNTEVFDSDNLPRVKRFALVLWAADFNPEKYETLCRILSKTYCKTGNAAVMLQLYLSVVTKGCCITEENGTFVTKAFKQESVLSNSNIRSVIETFGLETILIYTAILLKRKVMVYHHSLDTLLKFMRALPTLVWHRQCWDTLYPWIDLNSEEIYDLKASDHYLAGCLEAGVESRADLYDVFVNLAATEISISPRAKESMTMTKTHKDIALFIVRLSEDSSLSDQHIIQEIYGKTKDLLAHLHSFATVIASDGKQMVSIEALQERNLSPALENFLVNLAQAEGLLML